ncbi:MAG: hypothetical protein Ct9H90mP4_04400 [Gammaproteobacteria bacterium]|nr:MAG: hypothetical protein Ct9H90mP4_04400 [Gammaproteobacteria bacterium]
MPVEYTLDKSIEYSAEILSISVEVKLTSSVVLFEVQLLTLQ